MKAALLKSVTVTLLPNTTKKRKGAHSISWGLIVYNPEYNKTFGLSKELKILKPEPQSSIIEQK